MILQSYNKVSDRTAVVEDNGVCCWLYLTSPSTIKPVKDVWLYNRISLPEHADVKQYEGSQPPAPNSIILGTGIAHPKSEANFSFKWSKDGEAVAVYIWLDLFAFIGPDEKQGYNRFLSQDCPWGKQYSAEAFDKFFPENS